MTLRRKNNKDKTKKGKKMKKKMEKKKNSCYCREVGIGRRKLGNERGGTSRIENEGEKLGIVGLGLKVLSILGFDP